MLDAARSHVMLHAQHKVIDDAVAVLHHGGTHLHVAATQLNELQSIVPSLYTAEAAQFHGPALVEGFDDRIGRHLKDIAQGNRFHGTA